HSACSYCTRAPRDLHSFPTRRSSDLGRGPTRARLEPLGDTTTDCVGERRSTCAGVPRPRRGGGGGRGRGGPLRPGRGTPAGTRRSEEHTSELQSPCNLVCRLLLEKKK